MKRVSRGILLLVVLSFAILAMGAASKAVLPSSGEMKSGIYKNKYFDLQFVIPKGMTYLSSDVIAEKLNKGYEKALKDKIATKEEIERTKKRQIVLFRVEKNSADENLAIEADCSDVECMEGLQLDEFVKRTSEIVKEFYKSAGCKCDENVKIAKVKLGNYEYEYFEMKIQYGNQSFKQREYYRVKDKYLLMLNVIFSKDAGLNQITKSFK